MKKINMMIGSLAFALVFVTGIAQAAQFETGRQWTEIGNIGNDDDGTGYGRVDYEYRISNTASSVEDYDLFFAGATTDAEDRATGLGDGTSVGEFNANYDQRANANAGREAPAVNVNLHQAAQYANWLTSGNATVGAYDIDASTGEVTGYTDHDPNTSDMQTLIANHGTVYTLASEDEWYKAAYYSLEESDGSDVYYDFAHGSDNDPPVTTVDEGYPYGEGWNYNDGLDEAWSVLLGTEEQNGTYSMMGNIREWMESSGSEAVFRGGRFAAYGSGSQHLNANTRSAGTYDKDKEANANTIRLTSVPEPSSLLLLGLAGLLLMNRRRR